MNPIERAKHLVAIQRVADETGCDVAFVLNTYENELERLEGGASVRDYLLVLTARYTMEILRKSQR